MEPGLGSPESTEYPIAEVLLADDHLLEFYASDDWIGVVESSGSARDFLVASLDEEDPLAIPELYLAASGSDELPDAMRASLQLRGISPDPLEATVAHNASFSLMAKPNVQAVDWCYNDVEFLYTFCTADATHDSTNCYYSQVQAANIIRITGSNSTNRVTGAFCNPGEYWNSFDLRYTTNCGGSYTYVYTNDVSMSRMFSWNGTGGTTLRTYQHVRDCETISPSYCPVATVGLKWDAASCPG